LEIVPARNFRIEIGNAFAAHDINGIPGADDRRQLSWQGVSVDFRYRFLDRDAAPLGLTLAVESHADRIDETTAAVVRNYGTEFALAFDRELVPNIAVAALKLIYRPEWTRFVGKGAEQQESTIGAALGAMVQICPGVFFGGEARYQPKYEGIGLEEFAGQALFVGPTMYFKLSEPPGSLRPGALRHGGVQLDRVLASTSLISSATKRGWCWLQFLGVEGHITGVGTLSGGQFLHGALKLRSAGFVAVCANIQSFQGCQA